MDIGLEDFWDSAISQIRNDSACNGLSEKEEFVNFVSQLLLDGEEITDEIEYVHYEGIGTRKRAIQLDGYYYDDCDDRVFLYVVPPFSDGSNPGTLTNEDIKKYMGRGQAFLTDVEFIFEHAEESQPAYGLAADFVEGRFKDTDKITIAIITDRLLGRSADIPTPISSGRYMIEYRIWDIQNLYMLNESQTGRIELVVDLKEDTNGRGIPCLLANQTQDYTSYLCNIPGSVVAKLFNRYGSRLLEGNIRSFLQIRKGGVNDGIRRTILTTPEKFFIYNNGLTATASDVKVEQTPSGTFMTEIESLQIVNGGQTTASLAMAYLYDTKNNSVECIEKISVPMKLTVVDYDKGQNLIPEIARFANSQNKVSTSDLSSNSGFHIRMEEISRKLLAPPVAGKPYGTYWFYERARGQYKQKTYKKTNKEKQDFLKQNPTSQKITKTDFSKYAFLLSMRPDYASLGGEKGFPKFNDEINKAWDKNPDQFNETYFKEIVSVALLFKFVDSEVRKRRYEYKANINAYVVSYMFYLISEQCPDKVLDYRTIWNTQDLPEPVKEQLIMFIDIIRSVLISPNRKTENVTEWAKRQACWDQVKEQPAELMEGFKAALVDKDSYLEAKRSAKKEQKQTNAVNAMVEVNNYGLENWKALLNWADDSGKLSGKELSFINTAVTSISRGRFPSDKQCIRILEVLERSRTLGYLG